MRAVRRWIVCLLVAACGSERDDQRRNAGWAPGTVWVAADRDGDALVELDGDLFVLGRQALESPLLVRAGAGQAWVLHAPSGAPGPPLALRARTADGFGPAHAVVGVRGLEVDAQGCALVLAQEGGVLRLSRHGALGGACELAGPKGAVALTLGPAGPAVALGPSGWAERDPTGRWCVRPGLEGAAVLDLAPCPQGGWWTVEQLPGEPGRLVVTRDRGGVPRQVRAVGDAHALARRTAGAWAWARDERTLVPPVGPALALEAAGARAAVGDERGGVVLAAAGALLRLTSRGHAAPGQGGFARLVDLERLGPGP